MTYPEEVEETIGTPIEVEPLNETKLEKVGLNCNHNTPLSSREVSSFDGPEPQPLLNSPSLDVSLRDVIGPEPPIKPYSPNSFRTKVVEPLTIHTPPLSHVASFHLKDMYFYYRPCVDDLKKHYGFKPGLLGHSGSLGVDFLKFWMIEYDWESKEVSFLGRGLNSPVRPKEVEKIIMVNVIPPDHVDDVPIVEPNQHDDVPVIPEHVLVDEDEDPKKDEFEEKEDPQEEEDDMKSTSRKTRMKPEDAIEDNNGLLPGLMRRDINSLFGRMASLLRRLCGRETAHALVEKKGKTKDEYYGKLILDLGNEMRSSVKQGTAVMEKLVEKLGNAEDKNERVERDLYWTRVRAHEFYQEMIRRGFVFVERPNEAINVPIEDEKSPSFEPRGSPHDS
ncbi:hypothetical protein Tco_0120724 [Tanacetum coccineum]